MNKCIFCKKHTTILARCREGYCCAPRGVCQQVASHEEDEDRRNDSAPSDFLQAAETIIEIAEAIADPSSDSGFDPGGGEFGGGGSSGDW